MDTTIIQLYNQDEYCPGHAIFRDRTGTVMLVLKTSHAFANDKAITLTAQTGDMYPVVVQLGLTESSERGKRLDSAYITVVLEPGSPLDHIDTSDFWIGLDKLYVWPHHIGDDCHHANEAAVQAHNALSVADDPEMLDKWQAMVDAAATANWEVKTAHTNMRIWKMCDDSIMLWPEAEPVIALDSHE